MSKSKMPARIWAGPRTGWTADRTALFEKDTVYIRADIVEAMAEALGETLAKFDACSNSTVRNTPLGLSKLRIALTSYREATNDKA